MKCSPPWYLLQVFFTDIPHLTNLTVYVTNIKMQYFNVYKLILILIVFAISADGRGTYRRSVNEAELEDARYMTLDLMNEYRERHAGLGQLELDDKLTQSAQHWAEHEAQILRVEHSCERCTQYTEALARRRSSRPLPRGEEAGKWLFQHLFGGEDKSYDVVILKRDITKVGIGIAYARGPDKLNHVYTVLRFASH